MATGTEVKRTPGGRLLGTARAECEPGVALSRVPVAARACDVFTPAEMRARIRHYARLASRGLPLFRGRA